MSVPPSCDVARAARLAAAMAADDQPGIKAVLEEAISTDALVGLVLALAIRHVNICREYYDTDCQKILDTYAMEVMNAEGSH